MVPNIPLADGTEIPQLGFGTFKVDAAETAATVKHALRCGYRHVDTAKVYGNEEAIRGRF